MPLTILLSPLPAAQAKEAAESGAAQAKKAEESGRDYRFYARTRVDSKLYCYDDFYRKAKNVYLKYSGKYRFYFKSYAYYQKYHDKFFLKYIYGYYYHDGVHKKEFKFEHGKYYYFDVKNPSHIYFYYNYKSCRYHNVYGDLNFWYDRD